MGEAYIIFQACLKFKCKMAGSRIPYTFQRGLPYTGFKKEAASLLYKLMGFNKYGLMRDDIRMETSDVKEALTRLPPKLYDERQFRISRAIMLSCQRNILPKEQWTKLEDDVMYLKPYIEEVQKERAERAEWLKGNKES